MKKCTTPENISFNYIKPIELYKNTFLSNKSTQKLTNQKRIIEFKSFLCVAQSRVTKVSQIKKKCYISTLYKS